MTKENLWRALILNCDEANTLAGFIGKKELWEEYAKYSRPIFKKLKRTFEKRVGKLL